MPRRKTILANDQIYHVFNKAIDGKNIFQQKADLDRALMSFWYYQFISPSIPLSRYLELPKKVLINYHNHLIESKKSVEVYCYCFMNNHFHLLLKQLSSGGISSYLSNIQNSYTRYYNTKNNRKGALLLNQFKAVRIETDEQLVHVSRYIHLNPLTGYLIKNKSELQNYPYSSFSEYLGKGNEIYNISNPEFILGSFKNKNDYKQFVYNRVEYQRELDRIKHLVLED